MSEKNQVQAQLAQNLSAAQVEYQAAPENALFPGGKYLAGQPVPQHFGNPFQEEEWLLQGKGYADLSLLEVVRVSGADRLRWLHSLSTCPFENLAPGMSAEMLILSPNGQIEHAAAAIDDGAQVWLILDMGKAAPLIDFLEKMKFMMRVEISQPDFPVLGFGVRAAQLPAQLRQAAVFCWEDSWPAVLPGGADYGVPIAQHPGRDIHRTLLAFTSREEVRQLFPALLALDWHAVGFTAWEAARIRAWRPRPANEMCGGVLPHELDLLRTAVHLEKGCYRGQETVAKIVNLGRPPRRLTYLYLESADGTLPAVGSVVYHGKRKVGVLTSVARDCEEGAIALALLKRNLDLQATLQILPAAVEATATEKEGAAAAESAPKAPLTYFAAQVEIVAQNGKSSVSPAERPGQEFSRLRHQ